MTAFAALTISIIIEGFPYIMLGAALSALLEVFVPAAALRRVAGHGGPLNILVAALAGIVLPVCECGIVPVVARLRAKGVANGPLLAYLFAAPAVQPIVFYSTLVAFNDNLAFAALRCAGSLVIAVGGALLLARALPPVAAERAACGHDHACGCAGHDEAAALPPAWVRLIAVFVTDAVRILAYLTVGAMAATVLALLLPPARVAALAGAWPLLAVPLGMLLAFVLSVCSEADAFVAYAMTGLTPLAQLAFLWFGPVADIKLAVMYSRVFGRQFTLRAFLTLAGLVLLLALLLALAGVAR
ncbi:MAG TPA: permease [bacterium]|nr:permease [bacterium]